MSFRDVAAAHRRCVWLDGVASGWGGRSWLAWLEEDDVSLTYDAGSREVTRHAGGGSEVVGDDVFAVLGRELSEGPRDARWFGYLGYAARPDLPARPDGGLPDAVWMRPSHVEALDLATAPVRVMPPGTVTGPLCDDTAYDAAFARVREHLLAGDTYEANLTYRVERRSPVDPVAAYLRLRDANPAPYAGFLRHDVDGARAWLLSSSPERFARVHDRVVEARPIKGTTPRGTTPAEDEAQRTLLASDPRFRAESLMIVDLLRSDLARVCVPGSVSVPALMEVESYASVHQLVSTVRGRLRDGVSTLDAVRALFPAASMTGAPKPRTMRIVDEVEWSPRGVYSGAFGWIDASGEADLGVVIRSLTTAGDGRWWAGTGGGITVHSTPDGELAESEWKVARVLSALEEMGE